MGHSSFFDLYSSLSHRIYSTFHLSMVSVIWNKSVRLVVNLFLKELTNYCRKLENKEKEAWQKQ